MNWTWNVFCKITLVALFFTNMILFVGALCGWIPPTQIVASAAFWSSSVASIYLLEGKKK